MFDELHITPDGAHFVEMQDVAACADPDCGCYEDDAVIVESIDGLTSACFITLYDDMSGSIIEASDKTYRLYSCGCPISWRYESTSFQLTETE